jgi:ribonucleoside-diphosphate reductase alpha chain
MEMAEYCIDNAHYELPHIGYTAKRRRSIGIGVIGLATMLARKGLKYDTQEGLNYIHQLMERHAWHAINASLELGQKYGNAPWMHKTKWPEGWLPIDTYNRNVDELVTVGHQYDWEELRARVLKNGGIRHSVLCSLQPTESSSKSAAYPNAHLPVRDLELRKTDGSNAIEWVAYDNDILNYQLAWDIKPVDMIKVHAVCQKWFDQGISADVYRDRRVSIDFNTSDLNEEYMAMHYYGQKTRYYSNSITTNQSNKSEGSGDCASGACKM